MEKKEFDREEPMFYINQREEFTTDISEESDEKTAGMDGVGESDE